jgi:hypothetical protein
MSTDHQKYSLENQTDAIAAYAAFRGIEIVRTYADLPPLKWSSLKYVLTVEDRINGKEEAYG